MFLTILLSIALGLNIGSLIHSTNKKLFIILTAACSLLLILKLTQGAS